MSTDALPAAAGIGRVSLRVADLEAASTFYEDVIGFERLDSETVAASTPTPDGDRAVLGAGGEALLVLDGAPDAPTRTPTQAGLYHVAIRVPDRPALGAAVTRLQERDLIDGAADHGVSEAIYCRDPEGNGLEIYVDRPREAWPMQGDRVQMVTDPLDLDELVGLADAKAGDDAGTDDGPEGDGELPEANVELPADTTIGHVHLEVTDLDPTHDFYADGLGMALRQRMGEQALFLAAGEYHHHVGANTWRRRSEPAGDGALGLAWFEVVVPGDAALEAAETLLQEAGYDAEREHDGTVLAVADPDGIGLRLRADGAIATPTGE